MKIPVNTVGNHVVILIMGTIKATMQKIMK